MGAPPLLPADYLPSKRIKPMLICGINTIKSCNTHTTWNFQHMSICGINTTKHCNTHTTWNFQHISMQKSRTGNTVSLLINVRSAGKFHGIGKQAVEEDVRFSLSARVMRGMMSPTKISAAASEVLKK